MKSMMLAAAGLFGAMFCASAAKADCPPGALQHAGDILTAAAQPTPNLEEVAAKTAARAESCTKDPHVLRVAAMTYQTLTGKTTDHQKAFGYAVRAWTSVQAMRAARADNEAPRTILFDKAYVNIDVYSLDGFEARILENLFITEVRSGKFFPDHAPLSTNATRACNEWDSSDVHAAALFVRKNIKTDIPPALNYINRMLATCDGKINPNNFATMIALRTKVNYELLKDRPDRPNAQALLDQALADSKRFFSLRPNGDSIYWSTYDRDRLTALVEEMRPAPLTPEADWFKPGNPEKPETVKAIAKKLDAAWAIDEPLGIGAKYQNYRGLITDLYKLTSASGNVAPARKALAHAAKGHSDGSLRAAANKGLKSPPDFLWKWIDPSVTPTEAATGAQ